MEEYIKIILGILLLIVAIKTGKKLLKIILWLAIIAVVCWAFL